MSSNFDRSTISRLQREISDLRSKEAAEIKRQADLNQRMNRAASNAARASNASTASMHLREVERHSRDLEQCHRRHAAISDQIARKTQEAARIQDRLSRTEAAESKKRTQAEEKRQREHNRKMGEMEKKLADLTSGALPFIKPPIAPGETETHDLFICHASEDKADFADELATKAKEAGLNVWYDAFKIDWGDSLRQKIDHGLAGSYFGVVVLSSNFFAKPWTNYELDALVQKDMSGEGRLLPIWHKVTIDEIRKASPALAGRVALKTSDVSTDEIVEKLLEMRDQLRAAE